MHEISRVRENGRRLRVDAPMVERFRSGHPAGGGTPSRGAEATRLEWEAPAGWVETRGSGMRHADFRIGTGAECSIVFLPGGGGGVAANINRWRRQMNLSPLDPAAIASLPHAPILGASSPVLEAYSPDGRGLLATYARIPGRTLFVKLVGSADRVKEQKDAYLAFCASLRSHP